MPFMSLLMSPEWCSTVRALHTSSQVVLCVQAAVRARIGEGVTAFTRIDDGVRSVAVGDVVRLAVRPALMGVVQHFIVHQARHEEDICAHCCLHVYCSV